MPSMHTEGDPGANRGKPAAPSPAERFEAVAVSVETELGHLLAADWTAPARHLEWSCWQTLAHMVDCTFSYALQVAARAQAGFLPFRELQALPEATAGELLLGLRGVAAMLAGALGRASVDVLASDGVVMLDGNDWAARGAYELLLHAGDICGGLGAVFEPDPSLCDWVSRSERLWMLDRRSAQRGTSPWHRLVLGSGRPVPA